MTKQHLKVGITGGIGAGKTLMTKIFSILGVPVYDADSRAKWLMNHDSQLISQVKDLFGEQAYDADTLNREYIGKVAFSQSDKLKQLNELVHPKVGDDYLKWVNEQHAAAYSLKEAALLFESGSYKQLDSIIYVTAPEELRIRRVLKRDTHRTEQDVRNIIHKQWPEQKKMRLADHLISNDLDSRVLPQVLKLHEQLLSEVTR